MHTMDWDDLRFVLALARDGSLSSAARTLHVTHTTVSRRLKAFEEKLGVHVFDRLPDGYVPTEVGATIVTAAERMESEAMALDLKILGRDASLSGTLRIGTVDTTVMNHTDLFATFVHEYPGVELQLLVGNDFHSLSRREADIALRFTNRPPEHLVGRKLGRMEFGLYASSALIERVESREPADYPWISWPENSGAKLTEAWMRKHVPDVRIAARADASMAMYAMLESGMGIGFIPCIHGDSRSTLQRLRLPEPGFGMDLWVLTHPDLRRTARVRAFLEHAGAYWTRLRPQLAGEPAP